ncbi:hypothetical protein EBU71_15755, partial [bacterium]|nr:hypothetical protein [Candidatus Elulimicrobium humile]
SVIESTWGSLLDNSKTDENLIKIQELKTTLSNIQAAVQHQQDTLTALQDEVLIYSTSLK